jgi:hypothetical protein
VDKIEELLHDALPPKMSARDVWQKRVSFALGQVQLSNPAVTREQVEKVAEVIYGPCPDK